MWCFGGHNVQCAATRGTLGSCRERLNWAGLCSRSCRKLACRACARLPAHVPGCGSRTQLHTRSAFRASHERCDRGVAATCMQWPGSADATITDLCNGRARTSSPSPSSVTVAVESIRWCWAVWLTTCCERPLSQYPWCGSRNEPSHTPAPPHGFTWASYFGLTLTETWQSKCAWHCGIDPCLDHTRWETPPSGFPLQRRTGSRSRNRRFSAQPHEGRRLPAPTTPFCPARG